ncbi:MAG: HAD family hydrolase [Candidatus Bathyarchaeia archaeon]
MRVKAVLFDLFDTLLLIEGGNAFYTPCLQKLHKFLAENGGVDASFEKFRKVYFEVRDALYTEANKNFEEPHFNIRIWKTLQKLGYDYNLSDAIIVKATECFAEEFMNYVSLDEDAVGVLRWLYGKYKLGIVSNFAIPECVWKLLEKYNLRRFFDVVVISAEVNKRKPSPEIFKKALESLNVASSEAVFVGDTPSMDIEGAKNVGMKAILVSRRTSATDTSKPASTNIKPDAVVKSLKELPEIISDC